MAKATEVVAAEGVGVFRTGGAVGAEPQREPGGYSDGLGTSQSILGLTPK